ncbi:MAG: hypothetical protein JXN59_01650 [Anaerolineae bacterium]|nr:hypothetical protein [Anaerolineae bacterium]
MSINVQFTDDDWARIEQDWAAWWAGELSRPLVWIEGPAPQVAHLSPEALARFTDDNLYLSDFGLDTPVESVIDHLTTCLENTRFYGDAFPKWWVNYGPGIMAGFLGAGVHAEERTVWFSPPEDRPLDRLQPAYDAQNPWWLRVQAVTRAAVERWGDRVAVGHTDLGGNLDILASLRGTQRLLLDLYDTPQEVDRLVGEITRLWLRYYDELYAILGPAGRGTTPWAAIWSPARTYMLQSDFAYMISPVMFERFVMPDLAAMCEHLDHAFYHLDGKGQIPHVDMLLSLERLRGIQWIPGAGQPDPETWGDLLRRIRAAGKLMQLFVTPQGALQIVREFGGQGFVLCLTEPLLPGDADDFLRLIAREAALA